MNKSLLTAAMTLCLCMAAAAAPRSQSPSPPQIAPAEGTALVALARSAMVEYLLRRTPADVQAIPEALKALEGKSLSVGVTLRDKGTLLARRVVQDKSLPRNVIAAALAAMRSPRAPDVVTAAYLSGLTVEIEVLGESQTVSQADLPEVLVPGLTGVSASRGLDDSFVLPSESYVGGFDVDEIVRTCLAALPIKPQSANLPVRWAAFASSHYVGYPDGKTYWLYRGKALLPPEMIDKESLSSAAQEVGLFLLRNVDKSGAFGLPEGTPTLAEQMYATFAMARLAARTRRKEFSSGANAALAFAVKRLSQQGGLASFAGVPDDEQIQAASLLVMAIRQMPANAEGDALCKKVLAGIDKAVAGLPEPDANAARRRPPLKALALAHLAASAAGDAALRAAVDKWISAHKIVASDAETASWLIVAGIVENRNWTIIPNPAMPAPVAAGGSQLDEAGGFAAKEVPPTTVSTALAAANLAAGHGWPGMIFPKPPATDAARRETILGAKRFCRQMMYKPCEVYHSPNVNQWIGGVRASPQTAHVTLWACAAAIEALLTE